MFNQYKWLVEALAVLAIVGTILFGIHSYGQSRFNDGKAYQAGEDQKEFDRLNAQTTKNKDDASRMIQARDAAIIALQEQQDRQRIQQEQQHAQDLAATDAIRREYAARSLRVSVTVPQVAGRGSGSGVEVPGSPVSPVSTGTEFVELPTKVTSDLRQLTLDADNLSDNYRKCYRFLNPTWQEPVNVSSR